MKGKMLTVSQASLKMGAKEIRQIKLNLGLQGHNPLRRCPAKALIRVRRAEAKGDYSHSSWKHICPGCSCRQVAGAGTSHYGYGWCRWHEHTEQRKSRKEEFALRHQHALQARNPSLYYFEDEYFRAVEKEAKDAQEKVGLQDEAKMIRANILEISQKARKGEELVGRYDQNGSPVPMSDKERVDLLARAARAVAAIIKIEHDILDDEVISLDNFKIWWLSLVNEFRVLFPSEEDKAKLKGIAKKIGEPRRSK